MNIPNDPSGMPHNFFSDLAGFQTEFQTRLADETMRYMRRLQGVFAPAAPGTVVVPNELAEIRASGVAGGSAELVLNVDNRQRVHSIVTAWLSPFVSADGVTWFPDSDVRPPSLVLPPGESGSITASLSLPLNLPSGEYRGVLLLPGFRQDGLPVLIVILGAQASGEPPPTAGRGKRGRASGTARARQATDEVAR